MSAKSHYLFAKSMLAAVPLALCALGSTAHAGVYCVGSVKNISSRADGMLFFNPGFRDKYIGVCNLQTTWNGISHEQCKSWQVILLSAQLTEGVVSLSYPTVTVGCDAIGIYESAPAPAYLMLGHAFN